MGRKPVVQYVVEELARCGIGRLLFVTGPGHAAIENHVDIDAELVTSLRSTGSAERLEESAFAPADPEADHTPPLRSPGGAYAHWHHRLHGPRWRVPCRLGYANFGWVFHG